FLWSDLVAGGALAELDPAVLRWLFLGFFIAFAIKAPMWPLHSWLPTAAGSSRPGTAVLLVGVLDKVGTYGMLRYCLELFPSAAAWFVWPAVALSLVSIVYGAILAIGQSDMLRLIAFTSVSHFGFITLGIFAMTTQGHSGAALYMVNHGFATGALFLIVGFLIARRGSSLIADYQGVQKAAPVLAGTFLVAGLAGLSLPGLAPFVSEFLVFIGAYMFNPVPAIIAAVGVVLAALYILWMYQRTMTGPLPERLAGLVDLDRRELGAIAPLVALIILFGVYPQPLLDAGEPSVQRTWSSWTSPTPPPRSAAPVRRRAARKEPPSDLRDPRGARRGARRAGHHRFPAQHRLLAARPDAGGLRGGGAGRAGRGLRPAPAAPPGAAAAGPGRRVRRVRAHRGPGLLDARGRGRHQPGARRRRGGPPGALPAGHHPGAGLHQPAADRRAARRRGRVRRAGRGSARQRGGARARPRRVRAHRGLPAGALRGAGH